MPCLRLVFSPTYTLNWSVKTPIIGNIDFPNSTFGSDPRSVKTTSIRTYNESASGNNTNLNAGWENLIGTSQSLTLDKVLGCLLEVQ